VVLELYPLSSKSTAGLRFGIRVPDLALVLEALKSADSTAIIRRGDEGPQTALLRDPDGHEIELAGI
jgi:hypothetical protein